MEPWETEEPLGGTCGLQAQGLRSTWAGLPALWVLDWGVSGGMGQKVVVLEVDLGA